MALDWDERHAYEREPRAMLPWVERVVPLEGRMVVEFGCGNGPVTCAIAERGANIVALDIDAPAVEEARRRLAERELEPEFVSGSFEELLDEVHAR